MKIVLLSEDNGADSLTILKNIVIKTLRNLEPNIDNEKLSFDLTFLGNEIVISNNWKSERGEPFNSKKRMFLQNVARLLRKPNTYLFWHIDSDATWTDSLMTDSENCQKFEELKISLSRCSGERTDLPVSLPTENIFPTFPCYSIESWLYRFLEQCQGEIETRHAEACEQLLSIPQSDFDLKLMIKDSSELNDIYNCLLSEHLNVVELEKLSPSFNRFLDSLYANNSLVESLESILFDWART